MLLYDNEQDRYQRAEVSAGRPEAVAELTEEMNAWLRRTADPWLGS